LIKKIRDISIIAACAAIILGIFIFIDMFRYEFTENVNQVIRYDRLTNTQCIATQHLQENFSYDGLNVKDIKSKPAQVFACYIYDF